MVLVIFLNIIVYIYSFYVLKRLKGIKYNVPYTLSILLFFIYSFLTPLYFYLSDRAAIFDDNPYLYGQGRSIIDFYTIGILHLTIANLLFVFGYFSFRVKKPNRKSSSYLVNPEKKSLYLFLFCFTMVLISYFTTNVNPLAVALGSSDASLVQLSGVSNNYLKNFADSMISTLIFLFYFKYEKRLLVALTLISFVLFTLMGFRYRIIITLLGYIFVYVTRNKLKIKTALIYSLIITVFSYIILFITYNRLRLTNASYGDVVYDVTEILDPSLIFEQTRGGLDDITIMKYYDEVSDAPYDYGLTFLYVFVRILPRSLVGSEYKNSLYPPPAFLTIKEAYGMPEQVADAAGETPLHYAYFVISFGIIGLYALSLLMGILIKYFTFKNDSDTPIGFLANVVIALALFQYITRGYFPAFVDTLAYMLVPIWLLTKLTNNKNQISV